ncbi:carboxylic ester hydrolase [Actinomadura cremea]|nr:carboxylic ester hydrolase [Actinomadura cremea]
MIRRVLRVAAACAVAATVLAAPVTQAAADAGPVVTTDRGQVEGVATGLGRVFRGIPYAAPPVGPLRWKAPQPAAAWDGVRPAAEHGGACAQNASPFMGRDQVTNEDCLYLDVYAPAQASGNLPVIVWFHGGAFAYGSGSTYDAQRLAAAGNVVVSVNYRLGVFGFLATPELSAEDASRSGNYGIMDQQAALRWVKANAAAFGGDAGNVTISGQSAGSGSVCSHVLSPASTGLFHRAVMQSGPCQLVARTLPEAETAGAELAQEVGCGTAECLRGKPAGELLDATVPAEGESELSLALAPTTGTPVLPKAAADAFPAGEYAKVPMMLGTTRHEASTLLTSSDIEGGPDSAIVRALTNAAFSCPARRDAKALQDGVPVHMYEFTEPNVPSVYATPPDLELGAYHGAELPLLFDFPARPITLNPAQRELAATMIGYWSRFAATGDPNGSGLPEWPAYRPVIGKVQNLHADGVTNVRDVRYYTDHNCAIWDNTEGLPDLPGTG